MPSSSVAARRVRDRYLAGAAMKHLLATVKQLIAFAAIALLAVSGIHAQPAAGEAPDPALGGMVERLIALRAEVERLQGEIDIAREERRTRRGFIAAQQAETEAAIEREGVRRRQLEEELAALDARLAAGGAGHETLLPAVQEALGTVRRAVAASLPFRRAERLAVIDELQTQLAAGRVVPQRAVNRLWAIVEDEFRLSRENAIYSQTIELDGQPVLAEVAKLGTAALYFRTRDERYGYAVAPSGDWSWRVAGSRDERSQIATLFDSLRKQIRQGYFTLPAALPPLHPESS